MDENKSFSDFVYNVENIVDELAIVLLSVGAIIAVIYSFFFQGVTDFAELGRDIEPWITMLALMIIGREIWILNNVVESYLEGEQ
jgi:hypothetical protein